MPYIPKQHEKYELLPNCRKHGGDVFEYPSDLLNKLEGYGLSDLDPYGYISYDAYYNELDKLKLKINDEKVLLLIRQYKQSMLKLNQKENWSVLKYIGESTSSVTGLTQGRYYYWPCAIENAIYRGVIDDEEYTAYIYPTESSLWDIAEDPTGMAYRTIYEEKNAVTQQHLQNVLSQIECQIKGSDTDHLAQD